MRRFLIGLILLLLSGSLFAVDCVSSQSGNWTASSTWGGTPCAPTAADYVRIGAGHVITGDFTGTVTANGLVINGTLNMNSGDKTFALADTTYAFGVDAASGATFNIANGTVINFTAVAGTIYLLLGDGNNNGSFVSDNVDLGTLKTVTAFSSSGTPGACIAGNNWTVTTTDSLSGLVVGDLTQFMSGAAMGRMFEIVAATSSTLTLCPSFPDGNSLGPRLTPHATRSAVDQPGSVPTQIPGVGDTFLAWHPWIIKTTGGNTWHLDENNGPLQQNVGRLEMIGGDWRNSGTSRHSIKCAAARPPVVLAHSNYHEQTVGILLGGGTPAASGCDKPLASWNVIHDGTVGDANYHLGFERGGVGSPAGGGALAFNTFYRTSHNNIQINSTGSTSNLVGVEVSYNTGFELDTSNSGECEFMETDAADLLTVQFNRAWKVSQRCGGITAKPTSAIASFTNNLYRGNYIQGAIHGLDISTSGDLYGPNNLAVGNYTESTWRGGVTAWEADYNIARRWSEGNAVDGTGNLFAIRAHKAEGNIMDGATSARATRAIEWVDDATDGTLKRVYRNNVGRALLSAASQSACLVGLPTATNNASIDVLHNLVDCGADATCMGIISSGNFAPTAAVTLNVKDNICLGSNAASSCAQPSGDVDVTDNLQNLTRFGGIGAAQATWSSSSGEVVRDPLVVNQTTDWNLQTTSKERGAGAVPAGSPIGIRGAAFPKFWFPPFLQAVMTVPVSVANDGWTDIDLDGFLAFLMNDTDSPDKCPWISDVRNATDNGGTTCINLAAGGPQTIRKGSN